MRVPAPGGPGFCQWLPRLKMARQPLPVRGKFTICAVSGIALSGVIFLHIVLFSGGDSPEREVSLCSGDCVEAALLSRRHTVLRFDPAEGFPPLEELTRADAVFLALHGGDGEDGTIQRRLEALGIFHYTGSDPSGAAMAMRKDLAKAAVRAAGIPVAAGGVLLPGERLKFRFPMVIKPVCGGSSVGLRLIRTAGELPEEKFDEPMLYEKLLPGREYSVGLLGGGALPPVEICPHGETFDYYCKYTAGATDEICPANIPREKTVRLQEDALCAARVLGLRDFCRIDFKEDARGEPHFLEANALPGMTNGSLLPKEAQAAGVTFPELCETIARQASSRRHRLRRS